MSDATGEPRHDGWAGNMTGQFAQEVGGIVRDELRAARDHVIGAVRPAGLGVALLATAGGCLVLGAGAASTTVLRMLETFLPRRLATAGLTAGYLAGALVLGRLGLQQLRAAGGASAWLADEVSDMVSTTANRVVPAGAEAARDAVNRQG
ncbi:phage holin family protein [Micromonospora krabiensis]|uniref:Putative Holin-X, holin superfamily III n=1 Tax=Micromonospora krabiensis TaxID=307121 RepID=A0A1C3MZD2_9ACTN|nr:phage holin family protein [Micromonospora krabiensis]SBV25706.1 Putative Holin-X, holin superfamily III [Micromonospora krabiensis]